MRSLLLCLHLYGGLLCSSYLVLFGLSSLNYNHHFGDAADVDHVSWDRRLVLPAFEADRDRALAVRDSLGLPGWAPWWRYRTDDDGTFHFQLLRPGKEYEMALATDGRLRVEEHRTGLWPVIDQLHALTALPNAPLISWWGLYTELCVWVVVCSAASGVYLWSRRRSARRLGGLVLGSAGAAALLFGLYIYAVG